MKMVQALRAEEVLGPESVWLCLALQVRKQRWRRVSSKPQCNPAASAPFKVLSMPSAWHCHRDTAKRSRFPWPFTCVRAHGQSWKPAGGPSLRWCYSSGEAGTCPTGETDPASHRGDWRPHRCLFWKQRTETHETPTTPPWEKPGINSHSMRSVKHH